MAGFDLLSSSTETASKLPGSTLQLIDNMSLDKVSAYPTTVTIKIKKVMDGGKRG